MDFKFDVRIEATDIFKVMMKKTYSMPLGVVNAVFFAASVLLCIKFYEGAGSIARGGLILLCLFLPVIQPAFMFGRARAYVRGVPQGLTMETKEFGLLVSAGDRTQTVPYKNIKKVVKTKDYVILNLGGRSGYMLFNRVLGDKKEEFVKFIESRSV